jgi:hypothetical protein
MVRLILLLCLTLLVTRIVGSHLHFCFDGLEPPVSIHTIDTEEHHETDTVHDDQDVQLPSATLVKQSGSTDDAMFLLAVFACVLLGLIPALVPIPRSARRPRFRPAFVLLPPSCGPPAANQH